MDPVRLKMNNPNIAMCGGGETLPHPYQGMKQTYTGGTDLKVQLMSMPSLLMR